jgi:membrane protein DedA with SNARE-associated domain
MTKTSCTFLRNDWVNVLEEIVMGLIQKYGYFTLYIIYFLGILGLPLAEETVMTFVGTLTGPQGPLTFGLTFFCVYTGTMTGMLISYFIGRKLGRPIIFHFGKWVKLTPKRIQVAEKWFNRYGTWAIFFGYYLPGVRQFNCYFAGATNVPFLRYLITSGLGAVLWVSTFLTLGHFIGRNFKQILEVIHSYMVIGLILFGVAIVIAISIYFWRKRKKTMDEI